MTVTREIACSQCGTGKTLDINSGFTFGNCACGNDLDAQMTNELSKTATLVGAAFKLLTDDAESQATLKQ